MGSFDSYAVQYDETLNRALAISGEDRMYFARHRVKWLRQLLRRHGTNPQRILDFGCGTGASIPFLLDSLSATSVVGVDISRESLEIARQRCCSLPAEFFLNDEYAPRQAQDLTFCNGVFHHIPLEQRLDSARYIARCLRPGGFLAFWENNPWNPGTRYIMSKIPFDRDARTLTAHEARRLLRAAGFEILRTSFTFFFPAQLRILRSLEPCFSSIPLGAQYIVLCRKPSINK